MTHVGLAGHIAIPFDPEDDGDGGDEDVIFIYGDDDDDDDDDGSDGEPSDRRSSHRGRGRARQGRHGNGASTRKVRFETENVDDGVEEFERVTNRCLTIAVAALTVACSVLLYDMSGLRGSVWKNTGSGIDDNAILMATADDDDTWWDDKPKRAWPETPMYAESVAGPKEKAAAKDKSSTSAPNRDDLKKKMSDPSTQKREEPEPEPSYHDDTGISAESYQTEVHEMEEDERAMVFLSSLSPWNVPFDDKSHLPVYWHIPLTAGITFQDIMSHCYSLVEANEVGAARDNGRNKTLQIVAAEDGAKYVNVDTTSRAGLQRAKELRLASSGLADIIMTPYLYDAATLFHGTDYMGKCLALLRHPIDRAVSMFYHLRDSNAADGRFRNMTIYEYAKSNRAEENWMVRFLTNRTEGAVKSHHLDLAKDILSKKCLVGLVNHLPESLRRFEKFFDWNGRVGTDGRKDCEERIVSEGRNIHQHPKFEEGSEVWDMLKKKNGYDLILYEHARDVIFKEQAAYTKED